MYCDVFGIVSVFQSFVECDICEEDGASRVWGGKGGE